MLRFLKKDLGVEIWQMLQQSEIRQTDQKRTEQDKE